MAVELPRACLVDWTEKDRKVVTAMMTRTSTSSASLLTGQERSHLMSQKSENRKQSTASQQLAQKFLKFQVHMSNSARRGQRELDIHRYRRELRLIVTT